MHEISKFIAVATLCAFSLNGICGDKERADSIVSDGKDATPNDSKTAQELDIYDKASSCPHRFHMGCLLDVVEKSCTGLQALETCANTGKCKSLDELRRIVDALNPSGFEAVNKCCCSKAYSDGGYEDCKTPDPVCKKAVDDHISKDLKENLELLKVCLKKKKQPDCKKALAAANWAREALQKARGEMWPKEGCQVLAPVEPISKCGFDIKPEARAIERPDLYCDAIIWQFKEMGASDPFMSKCKDAPKMPVTARMGDDGDIDDYGGEEPEVIDEEEESEESETPGNDETEKDMEEGDEESPDTESDGQGEQYNDEDSDAEEPLNLKDEL